MRVSKRNDAVGRSVGRLSTSWVKRTHSLLACFFFACAVTHYCKTSRFVRHAYVYVYTFSLIISVFFVLILVTRARIVLFDPTTTAWWLTSTTPMHAFFVNVPFLNKCTRNILLRYYPTCRLSVSIHSTPRADTVNIQKPLSGEIFLLRVFSFHVDSVVRVSCGSRFSCGGG